MRLKFKYRELFYWIVLTAAAPWSDTGKISRSLAETSFRKLPLAPPYKKLSETLLLKPKSESQAENDLTDMILKIHYNTICKNTDEDEVRGFVQMEDGRRIVFDLYSERKETEINLGQAPRHEKKVKIRFISAYGCSLTRFGAQLKYEDLKVKASDTTEQIDSKLAIRFSPFVNFRDNQYGQLPTDTPLILAYSIFPGSQPGYRKIKYTLILSDEDSMPTTNDTVYQMAKYGRTTDIEWIYEVELDSNFKPVRQKYQGALHLTYDFAGKYLDQSSDHPILYNYNLGNNNVYDDLPGKKVLFWIQSDSSHQKKQQMGHHLVPRERINYPDARERVMLRNPWVFKVSYSELLRERKAGATPEDQLFVLIEGKIESGKFQPHFEFPQKASHFVSHDIGLKSTTYNWSHLGDDLWGVESMSGVFVGSENLDEIRSASLNGKFTLLPADLFSKIEVTHLQFYRLIARDKTYVVEDVTPYIHYDLPVKHRLIESF